MITSTSVKEKKSTTNNGAVIKQETRRDRGTKMREVRERDSGALPSPADVNTHTLRDS